MTLGDPPAYTWGGWYPPTGCNCYQPWMSITPPPPCPVHTPPPVWQYPSNPVIQTWPGAGTTTTTSGSFIAKDHDDYATAVYAWYQRIQNRPHRRLARWLRTKLAR